MLRRGFPPSGLDLSTSPPDNGFALDADDVDAVSLPSASDELEALSGKGASPSCCASAQSQGPSCRESNSSASCMSAMTPAMVRTCSSLPSMQTACNSSSTLEHVGKGHTAVPSEGTNFFRLQTTCVGCRRRHVPLPPSTLSERAPTRSCRGTEVRERCAAWRGCLGSQGTQDRSSRRTTVWGRRPRPHHPTWTLIVSALTCKPSATTLAKPVGSCGPCFARVYAS
mmetsp:Transcript_112380/g.358810  ORF Transcript_112380/g.358810 Transcript_112380/m.358810 type:complete len:226 (+) Transcript_112380:1495-2172(+)